ncbi:MAG: pilus assembly protein TadG-related protein [Acidobacteriaceae bacterium]
MPKTDKNPLAENAGESGQILVSLLLMMALFLMAIVGFSVDLTNLWFHRQAAQSAADAACQAGALDMSAVIAGLSLPKIGFTAGTAGNCSASPGGTICFYANANGYNGSGLNSETSNSVAWTFPASVSGVTTPPSSITDYPFLNVTVTENVKTHFLYTVNGTRYQKVAATCTCGLVQEKEAAPMVVLNPTAYGTFTYSGGGKLTIVGGPQRSLQVNSTNATAIACSPSALIDTSNGGPKGTGSDVATVGGPAQAPTTCYGGGFSGGSTGSWHGGVLPIADPYAGVAAPTQPATSTTATTPHVVIYGQDGCPDHSPTNYVSTVPHSGCDEFEPGYYPSGINHGANDVLIFKPGIYYMNGSLSISGSSEVRLATPCVPACSPYSTTLWQQTDGLMFYFLSGSVNLSGGTGQLSSSRVDPLPSTSMTCDGSVPNSSLGMPSSLNGNILIGQCTQNGTYWDSYGDTTDARGSPGSRGLLIFQAHTDTTEPQMSGSGQLSFSGALYLHSTGYADVLNISGAASSGTFILGQIVTDEVNLSGSGAINLALNPSPSTELLKVGMLQ